MLCMYIYRLCRPIMSKAKPAPPKAASPEAAPSPAPAGEPAAENGSKADTNENADAMETEKPEAAA